VRIAISVYHTSYSVCAHIHSESQQMPEPRIMCFCEF